MAPIRHMWLLNHSSYVADTAEELNFKLHFILIDLNVNDVASGCQSDR